MLKIHCVKPRMRAECGITSIKLQVIKNSLNFIEKTLARADNTPVKQCLLQQFKWLRNSKSKTDYKFCWLSEIQDYLKIIDKHQLLVATPPAITKKNNNTIINEFQQWLQKQDERRIQNSSFIPHYPAIKTNTEREGYLNGEVRLNHAKLLAQIRLNKFSIKIGNSLIKLGSKCFLCSSQKEASVHHFLFECRQLSSTQTMLFSKCSLPPKPNDTPEHKYVDLLTQKHDQQFYNYLFLFWCTVAKLCDLCN